MPRATLPKNPTVDELSKAWTRSFAAAVREAAGSNGRLTPRKAAAMEAPYADNAKNYFKFTGKKSANADTVIDSGARYVRAKAEEVAGRDHKLSVFEMRQLPADLADDVLALRGVAPKPTEDAGALPALKAAVLATDVKGINDYGKYFEVKTFAASQTRDQVINAMATNDVVGPDADDQSGLDFTRGSRAPRMFADMICDAGALLAEDYDYAEGGLSKRDVEQLYKAVADRTTAAFSSLKLNHVELIEHSISEDGDIAWKILMGRQADGKWIAVQYQDNPF